MPYIVRIDHYNYVNEWTQKKIKKEIRKKETFLK